METLSKENGISGDVCALPNLTVIILAERLIRPSLLPIHHSVTFPLRFRRGFFIGRADIASVHLPRTEPYSKTFHMKKVKKSNIFRIIQYNGYNSKRIYSILTIFGLPFNINTPPFMHFSYLSCDFLIPLTKNFFGWPRSHYCTASLTSKQVKIRRGMVCTVCGM